MDKQLLDSVDVGGADPGATDGMSTEPHAVDRRGLSESLAKSLDERLRCPSRRIGSSPKGELSWATLRSGNSNPCVSPEVFSLSNYPWNESAKENIGRYKETKTNATKIPMQIMMAGSTKLSMAVTRVETSSS